MGVIPGYTYITSVGCIGFSDDYDCCKSSQFPALHTYLHTLYIYTYMPWAIYLTSVGLALALPNSRGIFTCKKKQAERESGVDREKEKSIY